MGCKTLLIFLLSRLLLKDPCTTAKLESIAPGSSSLDHLTQTNDSENLRPIKCSRVILKSIASWYSLTRRNAVPGISQIGGESRLGLFLSNGLLFAKADVGEPREDETLWDMGVFRKTDLWQSEIVSVYVTGLGLPLGQRLSWLTSVLSFQPLNTSGQWNPGGKKRERSPGISLYKEQKRNIKESQKVSSPPEKTKVCLTIQKMFPQYYLLMKKILSYMGGGRDGRQWEWKTRRCTLPERDTVFLVT